MQPIDIPITDTDPHERHCPDCGSTERIGVDDLPVGYDDRDCDMYLCLNCDHEWVECDDETL